MRWDYALYALAGVFFIVAGISFAIIPAETMTRSLSSVTTVVLGFVAGGLVYFLRPRSQVTTAVTTPTLPIPAPPPAAIVAPTEQNNVPQSAMEEQSTAVKEATTIAEEAAVAVEPLKPPMDLTNVKGIKGKRAEQLKMLGINTVADLTSASVEDLATKMKISPKFVEKWIANAREIASKN